MLISSNVSDGDEIRVTLGRVVARKFLVDGKDLKTSSDVKRAQREYVDCP